MADRYVVLGAARARSSWFGAVASWANAAILPIDFLKCLTVEELVARLRRSAVSAVLVDGALAGVDRSLFDAARNADVAVLVVADPRVDRDWTTIGAAGSLDQDFDADALIRLLGTTARPIHSAALDRTSDAVVDVTTTRGARYRGELVVMCGRGGSGVSTLAIALAQGLVGRPAHRGAVALADLALEADQAMYHDAHDVVPGVHELVDAHALGRPDGETVRSMLFDVERRGYALLLGMPRSRVWTALSGRGIEFALDGLRSAFRWVVTDVTAEFDGEAETGSIDLEERNALARTAVVDASCVVVVGDATLRGLRSIPRIGRELVELGVPVDRILPVVNRFSGSRRHRAEIHDALSALGLGEITGASSSVVLPERRETETIHANVDPMSDRLVAPLTSAVEAVVARAESHGDEETSRVRGVAVA
jgi:septum formation inhibitor-activating ATPase MinD